MNALGATLDQLDAVVFDFDGVLTNNQVYLNHEGDEWVRCSRGDGLGFDVLRKLGVPTCIISTEKNEVVSARAQKLQTSVIQGAVNKVRALNEFSEDKGINLERVLYVGNDLNDFRAMELCGYSACPSDSHRRVKEIATVILSTPGGSGVVRELLEDILDIDIITILDSE